MDHQDQVNLPGDSFSDEFAAGKTSFPEDRPAALKQGEKFIVFTVNEKLYAVPSIHIAEVIHLLPVTPLPGSPDSVLGVANLRGEILGVLSLKRFWKEDNLASSEKAKLIVLRSDAPLTQFAFEVDKLNEIVAIPDTEIEPLKEKAPSNVYGKVVRGSSTLHLIDIRSLVASIATG